MSDERAYQTVHTSDQYSWPYDIAPLTTIWTAPSPCPTIVDFQADLDNNSCVPPDFKSVWYSGGFYSPGICPHGYSAGCTPSFSGFSSRPTETAVLCVPTSYSCDTFNLHAYSMNGGSKVTVPAFEIRWAEADITNLETAPTLPGATRTGSVGSPTGSSTGASSTGANSPSASNGSSSNGLPTGAVVGIAVGVAALVAIIAAVLFLFWRRKNKRATQQNQAAPDSTAFSGGRAELDVGHCVGTNNGMVTAVENGKTDAWVPPRAEEADSNLTSNLHYNHHQQEKQELHGGDIHQPGHQRNPQELASQYHQGYFPQEVHGTVPAERYEMPDPQNWGTPQQPHRPY